MKDVKFESHKDEVLKAMKEQVQFGLDLIGEEAEGYAKKKCPVDTGRLRNSITHATKSNGSNRIHRYKDDNGKTFSQHVGQVTDEMTLVIGTNVVYAIQQETNDNLKHEKGQQAHFLRDSVTQHHDRYKKIMKTVLSD